MISLWSLIFPTITLGALTTELTFKELPNWIDANSSYDSYIESKIQITSIEIESLAASCVYLLPNSVTMKSLKFDSKCYNNYVCSKEQQVWDRSSISSREFCPMLGSIDSVSTFSTNFFTYILLEGCYIYDLKPEKVDVVWTITNYRYYTHNISRHYFNNITSSLVYKGEILFDDGSNNCSKLCEQIDCEVNVSKMYKEETFSLGILDYSVFALGVIIVIVILVLIFCM